MVEKCGVVSKGWTLLALTFFLVKFNASDIFMGFVVFLTFRLKEDLEITKLGGVKI